MPHRPVRPRSVVRPRSLVRPRTAAALVVLCTAPLLIACGADASGGSDASASAAAAPSPLPLVAAGTLTVATDATYPPMESLVGGELTGVDIDLARDLAARLGLEVEFVQVGFDDLLTTVQDHRADLIMSSMTDRAARQEQVDFVDYFVAGTQVVVAAGNPAGVADPASWCGRTAAVNPGTTNGDLVLAQSALCTAAGAPAVTVLEVENGESPAAVAAGLADLGAEDYPSAAHLADSSGGTLQLVGDPLQAAPYGIGVAKDRTALRDAVQVALQESIADGGYDAVLAQHGVSAASLRTTALNGGA